MVDRNTLIISLIDKLLAERRMSFEQFHKEFTEHGLGKDFHNIALGNDHSYTERTLMEHIRALFLIDQISKSDLDILARTQVFSPDGFSYNSFRELLINEKKPKDRERYNRQVTERLEKLRPLHRR